MRRRAVIAVAICFCFVGACAEAEANNIGATLNLCSSEEKAFCAEGDPAGRDAPLSLSTAVLSRPQDYFQYAERNGNSFYDDTSERTRKIRFGGNISVDVETSTEKQQKAQLTFPDLPFQIGSATMVSNLNLEKGNFLFQFFSRIMGYLQLGPFPLDFAREIIKKKATVNHIIIWKILKFETLSIMWIFMWLILTLSLPLSVFFYYCCKTDKRERLVDNFQTLESEDYEKSGCTKTLVTILAHILLLLLLFCVLLMLSANERISKSVSSSENCTESILKNVSAFIKKTETQISFAISSSVQVAMDAAHKDLDDVDALLSSPIQLELDSQTELKKISNELVDLKIASRGMSTQVSELLKDCGEARKLSASLQQKLIELSRLLTLLRQECIPRDQPLCETLQISSQLNISFSVDKLFNDPKLREIRKFEYDDDFDETLSSTRDTFHVLPRQIYLETTAPRAEIRSALNKHRNEIYEAIRKFEGVTGIMIQSINSTKDQALKIIRNVTPFEFWRWVTVLVLGSSIFFVWFCIICGSSFACCARNRVSSLCFATGILLASLLSIPIWTFGIVSLVPGLHAESLICRQLYDEPRFTILENLFGNWEIFDYADSSQISRGLRNCKYDLPVYKTFKGLKRLINLEDFNYERWDDFNSRLSGLQVNLTSDFLKTHKLQEVINRIKNQLDVNMTEYRIDASKSLVNHDLKLLAEQLEKVAKQLSDYQTVIKMQNLAKKIKIAETKFVSYLRVYRDKILYKIAAIEVMMRPLNKQVDISSTNLKGLQKFVQSPIWSRSIQNNLHFYTSKLRAHFEEVYDYIKEKLHRDFGKCRPLWDSYDSARTVLCKLTVDPLNGFSFACFVCTLLFLGLAPIVIRTVAQNKMIQEASFTSISHRRARNGLLIDEETWATPSPRTSIPDDYYRYDSTIVLPSADQNAWNVRRPEDVVPVPPRMPEPIFHITSPEPLQIIQYHELPESRNFISRAFHAPKILDPSKLAQQLATKISETPRLIKSPLPRVFQSGGSHLTRDGYESLKLIERVDRRSPKGWL